MARILIVEDSPTQAEKLAAILEGEGYDAVVARDGESALERSEQSSFDLIISDIMMPGITGYELCRRMKEDAATRDVPFMLLSTLSEPMDIIRGLKCGADNFLTKPYQPDHLLGRVRTILENHRIRAAQRVALGVEILFLGTKFTITSEKQQILDLLLSTFEDTVRANRELQKSRTALAAAKTQLEDHAAKLEERVRERTAELTAATEALQAEIAIRKKGAEDLLRTRTFLNLVIENIPGMLFVKDAAEHRFVLLNRAGEELLGYDRKELIGKNDYDFFPKEQADQFVARDREVFSSGKLQVTREEPITTRHKGVRLLETKKMPVMDEQGQPQYLLGFSEDVTERKTLEEQLRQAQKMEALGQLTGGLAHDFNNLLGIIIGNLDFLQDMLKENSEADELLRDALDAGLRGAELIRHLLAFARRQPLQPKRVEIDKLVTDMTKLLSRTLGEGIEIALSTKPDLWSVVADPARLEAALTNLCVNARDAMPRGGRLTISTSNTQLEADYAAENPEASPGEYVLLEVTDAGTGMPPEVVSRVFEPFFTTKATGKGTGPGLSMVFGFVKQSGGHVKVYSEVGVGTVVRIYLPRAKPSDGAADSAEPIGSLPTAVGREVVLAVEDNEKLRRVLVTQLETLGYSVLEAADGKSALEILSGGGDINLLLTDVVMPGGLDGRELAQAASQIRPGLKVLFTSGFPQTTFGPDSLIAENNLLLSKPYRKQDLAQKVRAALTA